MSSSSSKSEHYHTSTKADKSPYEMLSSWKSTAPLRVSVEEATTNWRDANRRLHDTVFQLMDDDTSAQESSSAAMSAQQLKHSSSPAAHFLLNPRAYVDSLTQEEEYALQDAQHLTALEELYGMPLKLGVSRLESSHPLFENATRNAPQLAPSLLRRIQEQQHRRQQLQQGYSGALRKVEQDTTDSELLAHLPLQLQVAYKVRQDAASETPE